MGLQGLYHLRLDAQSSFVVPDRPGSLHVAQGPPGFSGSERTDGIPEVCGFVAGEVASINTCNRIHICTGIHKVHVHVYTCTYSYTHVQL